MTDVDNCPFCSQATKGEAKDGAGGYYEFDCPRCQRFDMYNGTFRRMCDGKLGDEKPSLLEFIKNTPPNTIAYIGEGWVTKGDSPAVYEVRWEYRLRKGM